MSSNQYLSFFVAGVEYGLEILTVREIIAFDIVTAVPGAPTSIRGVINVRGNVIPVVDLAVKFGLPGCTVTSKTCIVIVEVELSSTPTVMGILVDAVGRVIDLGPEDLSPPPPVGTGIKVDYLLGLARLEGKLVVFLDADRVLSPEELMSATAAASPPAQRQGESKMKRHLKNATAALLVSTLLTGIAYAEDAPANTSEEVRQAKGWLDDVTINGFVSFGYSYNFNKPASTTNQFRVFDFEDNAMKLDVVELVAQRGVTKPGETGFRLDLTAGSSLPQITASSGLFRNSDGVAEDFDLQQAYLSFIAPLGRGVRFDAGKFITHTGAEVIEGYDGFNDQYTRSFLFGYAIPFTHTGVRATYAFTDKVSGMLMIANGWDNVRDNNSGKSIGAQVVVSPVKELAFYLNYIGGPEQVSSSDVRHLYDLVATWKPMAKVALTFNYDFATDESGPDWSGTAGYIRWDASERLSLALRAEKFNDPDGARTGFAQRLREVTLTPSYALSSKLILRGDLRYDRSDSMVFDNAGSAPRRDQKTLSLNAIYKF